MSTEAVAGPSAGAQLTQFRERLTSLASGFSARQRRTLAVTGVLVVAMVLAVSWFRNQVDWAPLYTQLQPTDASALTQKLTEKGIRYRLADGGASIEVPSDVVYQTRVDLAGVALPASGKVGYGVLDDQGLTTSEFGQRVGFQRAMEGELAKTIEAIDGVSAATVHLALPRDRVFANDDEKPSASVMVRSTTKSSLSGEQVEAIRNLVSSGIEGMTPDRVSVADAQGHVLAAPGAGVTASSSGSANEATTTYQNDVASAIEAMLTRSLGPGKAKVTVAADLDFDQRSSTKESYETPITAPGTNSAMPRSESTKSETYGSGNPATQGQLGADGTPAAAPGGSGDYSLNERQVDYAVGKTVETVNQAPGKVNRLSVAVLVDDKAVSPAEVTDLQQVVSAAAGIDPERGDTVVVSRQKFDTTVDKALAKELKAKPDAGSSGLSPMLPLAALAVFMLAGLGFVLLQMRRRKSEIAELEQLALDAGFIAGMERNLGATTTLPAVPADVDLRAGAPSPAEIAAAGPGAAVTGHTLERRRDERRAVVSELIDNQPDEVAQLLRGWLGDRRAVKR